LCEVGERDFGDADGGFGHVVRHDGGTEQLAIADRRKVNVEYDAVVHGQTHQLQHPTVKARQHYRFRLIHN